MNARPYQAVIIDQALSLLQRDRSVLVEMAMGTGKTFVGAEIVRKLNVPTLWLAHRIELVQQASRTLGADSTCAVISRDTAANRLEEIARRDFQLAVVDECHHAPTYRYEQLFAAMPNAMRLGLTATPDRADKRRVRKWFTSATTPYDIPTAVRESWLVPFLARRVRVGAVDISGVRVTSGDFAAAELDAVMRGHAAIDGQAQGILAHQGHRPTLVYCTSVAAAEAMTEALGDSARLLTGETDPESRAVLLHEFGSLYQTLVSVGVLTEGVDLPQASCVAMCRPTRSRGLYCQMVGRVGRPDAKDAGIDDVETTASERAAMIAFSCKSDALVLDFVGICGKHSVVTPADILGGSEAARRAVKRAIESGDRTISVADAIAYEDGRLEQRRALKEERDRDWALRRGIELPPAQIDAHDTEIIGLPMLPSQAKKLSLMGVDLAKYPTKEDAAHAVKEYDDIRQENGYASLSQLELLSRYADTSTSLTKKDATAMILQLKRNGWKWMKGKRAAVDGR